MNWLLQILFSDILLQVGTRARHTCLVCEFTVFIRIVTVSCLFDVPRVEDKAKKQFEQWEDEDT